ncbi:MAG: hypothetical protein RLY58_779 [Pseudomonadota bacterium]|jgi:1-aminocyclopropane-1-carboxylate deaminase
MLHQVLPASPVQRLDHPVLQQHQIELWIKRDDLLHPMLIGNKYRKSAVYFRQALAYGVGTLVSFGGAYSNHLLALAAMGQHTGIRTVGCVRGEIDQSNAPILAQCAAYGMHLISLSRSAYYPEQQQMSAALMQQLQPFAPYRIVPEGGTSAACLPDVAQIISELFAPIHKGHPPFDWIVCPVGTGGTVAGLLYGLQQQAVPHCRVLALCAAKGYTQLPDQGAQALQHIYAGDAVALSQALARLVVDDRAAYAGFGRVNASFLAELRALQAGLGVPLDYVYTAKALYRLFERIQQGEIEQGARMVFIHTGGYQTAAIAPY